MYEDWVNLLRSTDLRKGQTLIYEINGTPLQIKRFASGNMIARTADLAESKTERADGVRGAKRRKKEIQVRDYNGYIQVFENRSIYLEEMDKLEDRMSQNAVDDGLSNSSQFNCFQADEQQMKSRTTIKLSCPTIPKQPLQKTKRFQCQDENTPHCITASESQHSCHRPTTASLVPTRESLRSRLAQSPTNAGRPNTAAAELGSPERERAKQRKSQTRIDTAASKRASDLTKTVPEKPGRAVSLESDAQALQRRLDKRKAELPALQEQVEQLRKATVELAARQKENKAELFKYAERVRALEAESKQKTRVSTLCSAELAAEKKAYFVHR